MKDNREIPPELMAELQALAARPDHAIDTSDIPEVADFSNFRRVDWSNSPPPRSIAIDGDLAAWFNEHRHDGEKLNDTVNRVLREHVGREAA